MADVICFTEFCYCHLNSTNNDLKSIHSYTADKQILILDPQLSDTILYPDVTLRKTLLLISNDSDMMMRAPVPYQRHMPKMSNAS